MLFDCLSAYYIDKFRYYLKCQKKSTFEFDQSLQITDFMTSSS